MKKKTKTRLADAIADLRERIITRVGEIEDFIIPWKPTFNATPPAAWTR